MLGAHSIVAGRSSSGCSVACWFTSLLWVLLGLDILSLGGRCSRSWWFRTTLLGAGGAGLREKMAMDGKGNQKIRLAWLSDRRTESITLNMDLGLAKFFIL